MIRVRMNMAKGKTVYLTSRELDLLQMVFDYGNWSAEGREDEEELNAIRDSIVRKVSE